MRLALGQMCSAKSHAPNIDTMRGFAAEAAAQKADLLALPEVAGLMNRNPIEAAALVTEPSCDPFLRACCESAKEHQLWMQPGSTPVQGPGGRFRNHAVLISPDGAIIAEYDKVHLFDVALEGQKPIGESRRFLAGAAGAIIDTPLAKLGLTICYDLRFPYLYRSYAQRGAEVIFIPSAFTVATGKAHWEILLRARAIETGAFIVAAAQSGTHEDGRETWGRSLVIGPWGEVLLNAGQDAPRLYCVDLDIASVEKSRRQIPSLGRDRNVPITEIS